MTDCDKKLQRQIEALERQFMQQRKDRQSTLTLGGALRVNVDEVFVGRQDGQRALAELRRELQRRGVQPPSQS